VSFARLAAETTIRTSGVPEGCGRSADAEQLGELDVTTPADS
jgi:hypothetical protein